MGLRWGNGGEPEGLGWAWQPQNQPLSGNRVHQIGWATRPAVGDLVNGEGILLELAAGIGVTTQGSAEMLAGSQWVSGEEFVGLEAPAAFALQGHYAQSLAATANHYAGFISLQDFARLAGAFHDLRLPEFEQVRMGLAGQVTERPRPRHQAAHAVP